MGVLSNTFGWRYSVPSANILRQIVHNLVIVATVCNIFPQILDAKQQLTVNG